ncbi:hypothetical protein EDB84DRAFT_1447340 [Lactarius hengduanensis]|nr:hypothetical protein EDB84DRAFT_1447340 [Lactarius hengduanensis]
MLSLFLPMSSFNSLHTSSSSLEISVGQVSCTNTQMSDFRDDFGHWDGDSSSYYTSWEPQYRGPPPRRSPSSPLTFPLSPVGLNTPLQVIEHIALPQGPAVFTVPSTPVSSRPPTPRPATPLSYREDSPSVKYILLDNYPTYSSVPSPVTRPSSPTFDIRSQVATRSGAPLTSCSPSPELVYPDLVQSPLSPLTDSPEPSVHLVSPYPRPSSLPPHVATPDSPINYHCIAEGVPCIDTPISDLPHENQENIPPPIPVVRPPSCLNITTGPHPHQFINVQTPQGEEWHPISEFYQTSLNQIPFIDHLLTYPPNFPGVSPFRFRSPHIIAFYPQHCPLAISLGIPPLYACSQAVLDLSSQDLPLGTIKYNFQEGIKRAFAPLNTLIRQAYIGSHSRTPGLPRRKDHHYLQIPCILGGPYFCYRPGVPFWRHY